METAINIKQYFDRWHEKEWDLCDLIQKGLKKGHPPDLLAATAINTYQSYIIEHFLIETKMLLMLPSNDFIRKKVKIRQRLLRSLFKKLHTQPNRIILTLALIEEELVRYLIFERREVLPRLTLCEQIN